MVTPLPRRRPWKLARETVSLDRLSNGRLILGVGLGDPVQWDFGFFGEETEAPIRAQRLDEGLAILAGLWSGEQFSFQGEQYTLPEVVFRPRPLQVPRIPIWVGGWWPHKPPMRRAARWDGVVPLKATGAELGGRLSPQDVRDIVAYVRRFRTADAPFDVVIGGHTDGDGRSEDSRIVRSYLESGATWWIEDISPFSFGWTWGGGAWPAEQMQGRIRRGPPRL